MSTSTTTATYIIDASEQTFATEVLERSKSVPVVVDFWADWCALAGYWGLCWKN